MAGWSRVAGGRGFWPAGGAGPGGVFRGVGGGGVCPLAGGAFLLGHRVGREIGPGIPGQGGGPPFGCVGVTRGTGWRRVQGPPGGVFSARKTGQRPFRSGTGEGGRLRGITRGGSPLSPGAPRPVAGAGPRGWARLERGGRRTLAGDRLFPVGGRPGVVRAGGKENPRRLGGRWGEGHGARGPSYRTSRGSPPRARGPPGRAAGRGPPGPPGTGRARTGPSPSPAPPSPAPPSRKPPWSRFPRGLFPRPRGAGGPPGPDHHTPGTGAPTAGRAADGRGRFPRETPARPPPPPPAPPPPATAPPGAMSAGGVRGFLPPPRRFPFTGVGGGPRGPGRLAGRKGRAVRRVGGQERPAWTDPRWRQERRKRRKPEGRTHGAGGSWTKPRGPRPGAR